MTVSIMALFVTPAFAVARLGGSTTPMHAYDWVNTQNARFDSETDIAPSWTLAVQPDGSVAPFLPLTVTFRDGNLIRPVAPFFEVWVRLGESGSDSRTWTEAPLTSDLLAADGLSLSSLRVRVHARNRKATRRSGDEGHAFGNWQPLVMAGNDYSVRTIEGKSPPTATVPMIPPDRHIPLGSVQMLRSTIQPAGQPWSDTVRVDTIRFRYTPARGSFFGPPEAAGAQPTLGRTAAAVPSANAFLNPLAGWRGAATGNLVEPGDTYDVIDQSNPRGPSLGVVDDTCEVHFDVALDISSGRTLSARAVAFVAPPDFAPNHRPFLSIADELNDRDGDAAQRNADLTGSALAAWVEDLFERVYETVSLFNVDNYRNQRAATLPGGKLRATDIDHGRPDPTAAMGGRDALRSPFFQLQAASANDPLPLSQHARMRHRALSDLQNLLALVANDAVTGRDRIREIVRAPFEIEAFESSAQSSMRMPPFMRQSNAMPLTLATWQYALLLRWVDEVHLQTATAAAGALRGDDALTPRPLSSAAALRRSAVLTRIDAEEWP